jgi:hypothetical protein
LRATPRTGATLETFFGRLRTFNSTRPRQIGLRTSARIEQASGDRPQLACASARRATHRTVGMRNVDIHLVMATVALSGARTGHQLRLRSHWLELDYLAQLDASPETQR